MSMKEHYKRLLGEMAQTRARGEQMARDISNAQKHSDKTKAIRDKLFQDLQDIGADPDYDPNTHLDAAAETGLDLVAATDNHRDAFLNLVRLQRRNEMEQASRTLYDVDGQRVVTPRARRPEAAARSPRASRRSRGNIREDLQTPERATQTTRNIRSLGREATALGKRSDAIYQGIYGIHPRDARDISSLSKMDFSKVMADPFGHDYGDSVDAYIDARIAQSDASERARNERDHLTKIYGRGGRVVGTLASPGKPATGVGLGKTAQDFVGKKTAKKTSTTKPKPKASTKKQVKSFKKRLKEALLGEMRHTK
jgi:hypothetical protein